MNTLTNELRNKWVEALESGEYIQAFETFTNVDKEGKEIHCCIAVLEQVLLTTSNNTDVFRLLHSTPTQVKELLVKKLINLNDSSSHDRTVRDYSNVIPFIKSLELSS